MSVIYLYYTEDDDFGGSLSTAFAVPMLDQFLSMFGGQRACVHPVDADYKASAKDSYNTLEDAQAAYPDHEWIYLDRNATTHISEYQHPLDNVVYVVGHDADGYGDSSIGKTIKVTKLDGHAIPCLISAVTDRWSRAWQ